MLKTSVSHRKIQLARQKLINAVEDSGRLQNGEKQPNDENQLAVLDAIQQLTAEMTSMKHDLARLETSKKKRRQMTVMKRIILHLLLILVSNH